MAWKSGQIGLRAAWWRLPRAVVVPPLPIS